MQPMKRLAVQEQGGDSLEEEDPEQFRYFRPPMQQYEYHNQRYGGGCGRGNEDGYNQRKNQELSKEKGFLDWILEVQKFFDYMGIVEACKVKLVALRLKGTDTSW